jgi:hypothetical protein
MEPVFKDRKQKRKAPSGSDDPIPTSTIGDEILELETKATESPKYYNNISKLLAVAYPLHNEAVAEPLAILAVSRVFARLFADGRFDTSKPQSDQNIVVQQWLADRFEQFTDSLLSHIHITQSASLSITVLMNLVQQEVSSLGSGSWVSGLFAKILNMLTKESEASEAISVFLRDFFARHVDVRYYGTDLLW